MPNRVLRCREYVVEREYRAGQYCGLGEAGGPFRVRQRGVGIVGGQFRRVGVGQSAVPLLPWQTRVSESP